VRTVDGESDDAAAAEEGRRGGLGGAGLAVAAADALTTGASSASASSLPADEALVRVVAATGVSAACARLATSPGDDGRGLLPQEEEQAEGIIVAKNERRRRRVARGRALFIDRWRLLVARARCPWLAVWTLGDML
jgi:hypothetical protein